MQSSVQQLKKREGAAKARTPRIAMNIEDRGIPRCLPRAMRAASLSCILMLSVPVVPSDTAAIGAAVFFLERVAAQLNEFLGRIASRCRT